MVNILKDWKLLFGIALAYTLIIISFDYRQQVFWYLYTATILVLISISILQQKSEDKKDSRHFLWLGLLSGCIIYLFLVFGNWVLDLTPLNIEKHITRLYDRFSPSWAWQYLALTFVIAPGEELFWRGFIQKRLLKQFNHVTSILIAASLYSFVYIFTDYPILILVAFVCGIFWGILYSWKRSIALLIISHIVFDWLLLIILPIN